MSLPNVNIQFLPPQVNYIPQNFANIPMVIGASSLGTVGTVYTIAQLADLAQLGNGPAVHMLANILQLAQTTIYYVKPTTTNVGVASSVTKTIGHAVGTPTTIGSGNSSMIFTAKETAVSVTITQQMGMSVAPTATFVGGVLTINLGTDGGGAGNSTPNAIVTILNAVGGLGAAMTYTPGGTGLGIMVVAGNTPLPFGSTGAATVAGSPTDQYICVLKITQAGNLTGTPAQYALIFDGDSNNYTAPQILPNSGIVPIKFGVVDTGIVMTLTGAFDVGDLYSFTTTAPTVGITDIITAMGAAIADSFVKFGHFVICDSVDRNEAVLIDAQVQAVSNTQFLQAMVHTRDIAEGVPGETTAQWQTAISNDFAGLYVVDGLDAIFAGDGNFLDQYTHLLQRRSILFGEAPNRTNAPVQQAIGYVPLAYLGTSVLDGKMVYYDERVTPGLDPQRFIVAYSRKNQPGVYYSVRGWTFADPTRIGYDRTDYVNIIMETADILYHTALPFLMAKFDGIPVAESAVVPAGALSKTDAMKLQSLFTQAVRSYWNTPQNRGDNSTPATDITNPVLVLRNYSFAATRQLRMSCVVQPKGTAESINITLAVSVPQ